MKKHTGKVRKHQHPKTKRITALFSAFLALILTLSGVGFVAVNAFASSDIAPVSVSSFEELAVAIDEAESGDTILIAGTINIYEAATIGVPEKEITLRRADDLVNDPMLVILPFGNEERITIQNITFDGAGISAIREAVILCQSAEFENVSFIDCVSIGETGAVNVQSGQISFINCIFDGNRSNASGHMLIANGCEVTIVESQFMNGFGEGSAGAIFNNGTLNIQECEFISNATDTTPRAFNYGGAIYNRKNLYILSSLFSNNQSVNGGAVYSGSGSELRIEASTITGNSAEVGGGISSAAQTEIINTMIYRNTASLGAADFYCTIPASIVLNSDNISTPEGLTPLGWYDDNFDDRFDGETNITTAFGMEIDNDSDAMRLIFVFEEDIISNHDDDGNSGSDDNGSDSGGENSSDTEPDDSGNGQTTPPANSGNNDNTYYTPSQNSTTEKPPEESPEPVPTETIATLDKSKALYLQGFFDAIGNDTPITRGQMAQIIYSLLTPESREYFTSGQDYFSDVGDIPERAAINALANAGIVVGYDGNYSPHKYLTNAELATLAARFLDVEANSSGFTDISGHWGESHINQCVTAGLLADGELFSPNDTATSGQVYIILSLLLEYGGN